MAEHSVSDGSTATATSSAPYPTFGALQRAHLDFRQSFFKESKNAEPARPAAGEIRALIARARATGAIIKDDNERKAAQGILDYWCAELVSSPGATAGDFMPALLAPFDATLAGPIAEPPAASDKAAGGRSRELIRLAAAARLWRDSGKQYGYLLFGDAIAQAARFRDLDPDLAELVKASEIAATKLTHLKRWAGTALTLVLALLLLLATKLWMDARKSAQTAQTQTELAKLESEELKQALDEARVALMNARKSAEAADALDRRLEVSLTVLRRLLQQGVITRADLPPEIAASVAPAGAATFNLRDTTGDAQSAGYDPEFIGVSIPLPGLTAQHVRANYVNYSVALDTVRRLAAVAASNLDREKRVVLPRAAMGFAPDPNLPKDIQADPDWFKSPQIDYGHLTTRQEISWGPSFGGDAAEASRKLVSMVNVLTNVAPQFDTFNRYVWSGLEQWIVAEHNKKAVRVSIFTGPVFTADDPVIDGTRVPRRFWKIAASPRTSGPKGLVVDAFMIPQFWDGTNDKIARMEFVPAMFRVNVSNIERATGLDFGAAMRDAATSDSVDVSSPAGTQRPDVTVYFQFAGMTREQAVSISDRLKALGWKLPGEERTGAAANQNEVRYGAEADRAAGELLASDLRTLGVSRMAVKRSPNVKPGLLEIWVSQ